MTFLDYSIIVVVTVLFVLAFASYRKKPHCSCGETSGCSGNCAKCHAYKNDCENDARE